MKNKLILSVQILLLFCASFVVIPSFAQGLKYDEEVEFGNGLIKVKSNGRYGLLDENRKLKLPVEFQDMEFQEGYALLWFIAFIWCGRFSWGYKKIQANLFCKS